MSGLITLALFLPFFALTLLANLGEQRRWARYVTYGALIALNLAAMGFALLALLYGVLMRLEPTQLPAQSADVNWFLLAAVSGITALLASLPLFPAVRRWISTWLPIEPASAVHTAALSFAVYQVGLSLGQWALIGSLENLAESGLTLTVWDVLLSGFPLLALALLGVGLFTRRGGRSILSRLGLRRPGAKQVLLAIGITAALLALDYGLNTGWEAVDPAGYEELERVTDQLYGGLITVWGAIILGLSAGISEEVLYRGALQPRLGIVVASVLFAIGHVQYGFSIATLEVLLSGLVLGLVRNRANTTTCILIHAGYNASGVLLGLLSP